MSMDRDPIKVSAALKFAKEYYSKEGYDHAMRVAGYVAEMEIIPREYRDECVALAIMHDLCEDTNFSESYSFQSLPEYFKNALILLTKPKEVSYVDYCKELRCTDFTNWKMCAYWVKLADMKDHLCQKETLTDKLKEKYLEGLAELL